MPRLTSAGFIVTNDGQKKRRSQSYDRELQRQRCKKLQVALCALKPKIFSSTYFENPLQPGYYNAGVVDSCKF
jgi:hypothetical protein